MITQLQLINIIIIFSIDKFKLLIYTKSLKCIQFVNVFQWNKHLSSLFGLMFEFLRFICVQEKGSFSKHRATVMQYAAGCGGEGFSFE